MRATLFLALLAVAQPAWADRLNDNDVKKLLERIDDERDRFEDQLDGDLKRSILRGPGGEVDVERYLDDLQENVDRLKERFTPQYAASAEVTTILRQGSDIAGYMATQPPNFKGASEWNRLASSFHELAAVYGTTFPYTGSPAARRINDNELRAAADAVAKSADRYKKELDSSLKKDKSVDKATREAAIAEAEGLKKDAKALSSRLGGNDPASGEAKQLVNRARAVMGTASGRALSPAAQSARMDLERAVQKVAAAFGMPG